MQYDEVIAIGGNPCSGKTTLAAQLSKLYNLPVLSTDRFRKAIKKSLVFPTYTESFLSKTSIENIKDKQIQECRAIAVEIKTQFDEGLFPAKFILEGVAVIPSLISYLKSHKINVRYIFLIEDDKVRIKRVVMDRGLQGGDKYSPSLIIKTMKWNELFSEWLNQEIKKYNLHNK